MVQSGGIATNRRIFHSLVEEVVYGVCRKVCSNHFLLLFDINLLFCSLNKYIFSGVAGIVVAISCCAAVAKLGPGRVKCPFFAFSIEDVMVELMDLSHSLVSVERLHHLATEAGFELDFLSHFGRKVLLSNKGEEVEFWIGLAYEKLSTAFHKESAIPGKQNFHDKVNFMIHETIFLRFHCLRDFNQLLI